MDNRNMTITRPNLTDTSMLSVTAQHRSTAKSTYYNMPSSQTNVYQPIYTPNPQQMEAMDKKILKWSRQILRLTPTFPAAVMSSPQLLKLQGVPRFPSNNLRFSK